MGGGRKKKGAGPKVGDMSYKMVGGRRRQCIYKRYRKKDGSYGKGWRVYKRS
jgi:hypothetical protein